MLSGPIILVDIFILFISHLKSIFRKLRIYSLQTIVPQEFVLNFVTWDTLSKYPVLMYFNILHICNDLFHVLAVTCLPSHPYAIWEETMLISQISES